MNKQIVFGLLVLVMFAFVSTAEAQTFGRQRQNDRCASSWGATMEGAGEIAGAIIGNVGNSGRNYRAQYQLRNLGRGAGQMASGACRVRDQRGRATATAQTGGEMSTDELVAEAAYRKEYERQLEQAARRQAREDAREEFGGY